MAGVGDDAALVASAAAGRPLAEVASAAGVSISTVQRRLRDPDVVVAVAAARTELRRTALGRLMALRDVALTRVSDVLAGEDLPAALRAANLVLSATFKAEAAYDFHDRLAALEAAQADGQPDEALTDEALSVCAAGER